MQVVQDFGQQLFSQKSFDTSNLQGSLEFHMLYQVFCQITVSSQSPVAKLWLLYFHMVQLLFNYTQSLKIADRNLHLISLRKMSWIIAYNHTNCSPSLSLHWCEMTTLPSTHIDVHDQLQNGKFCAQQNNLTFSLVAINQAIEQMVNRDSKTKGGIIGVGTLVQCIQGL